MLRGVQVCATVSTPALAETFRCSSCKFLASKSGLGAKKPVLKASCPLTGWSITNCSYGSGNQYVRVWGLQLYVPVLACPHKLIFCLPEPRWCLWRKPRHGRHGQPGQQHFQADTEGKLFYTKPMSFPSVLPKTCKEQNMTKFSSWISAVVKGEFSSGRCSRCAQRPCAMNRWALEGCPVTAAHSAPIKSI